MELENIILCEVSQAQKTKGHICGTQTQYKYKEYYEKQDTDKKRSLKGE
jgi:hypothetical protein